MNEKLYEAISRLKAWIRDYGHEKSPVFIRDVEAVIGALEPRIEALRPVTTGVLGVAPWCTETGQNACTCVYGDGSYVCEFCRSQGLKGFMQ